MRFSITLIASVILVSNAVLGSQAQDVPALQAVNEGELVVAPLPPEGPVPAQRGGKDDSSEDKDCHEGAHNGGHKDKCKDHENDKESNTWWIVLLSVSSGLALIVLASICLGCCCCGKHARARPASAKPYVAPLPPGYALSVGVAAGAAGTLPKKEPLQTPRKASVGPEDHEVWMASVTSPPPYDSDLPPYSV